MKLYEALDKAGTPFLRKPRTVGELPTPPERMQALKASLPAVEHELGMAAKEPLMYGSLVFRSFKLSHKAALSELNPTRRALLLTRGEDLPLRFLPS